MEMPITTSGMTMGATTRPPNRARPKKRGTRASAYPAARPSSAASVALASAICSDSHAAWSMSSFWKRAAHHLNEKPAHTVTMRDSLNE